MVVGVSAAEEISYFGLRIIMSRDLCLTQADFGGRRMCPGFQDGYLW